MADHQHSFRTVLLYENKFNLSRHGHAHDPGHGTPVLVSPHQVGHQMTARPLASAHLTSADRPYRPPRLRLLVVRIFHLRLPFLFLDGVAVRCTRRGSRRRRPKSCLCTRAPELAGGVSTRRAGANPSSAEARRTRHLRRGTRRPQRLAAAAQWLPWTATPRRPPPSPAAALSGPVGSGGARPPAMPAGDEASRAASGGSSVASVDGVLRGLALPSERAQVGPASAALFRSTFPPLRAPAGPLCGCPQEVSVVGDALREPPPGAQAGAVAGCPRVALVGGGPKRRVLPSAL